MIDRVIINLLIICDIFSRNDLAGLLGCHAPCHP
jgi:hypothetical protein